MTLKPEFIAAVRALGHEAEGLIESLASDEPAVSVRLNRAKKAQPAEVFEPVEWCPDGFYLPARTAFTFDPAMHQGLYYVQDASSMAIAAVAKQIADEACGAPLRWLDACAAPGGKTTAIASQLPEGSLLVANEFDQRRAAILSENIAKWGDPRVTCVRGDAARFAALHEAFDVISADVPCSGEGMMRKDAEAAAQWSTALVADCARTQWRLVEALWQALRPGGTFVYSTCTFNRTENEEIVCRMASELGATGVKIPALERPSIAGGIGTTLPCYRFFPGRVRGEGLFLCVLQKPGNGVAASPKQPRTSKKHDATAEAISRWLEGDYATSIDAGGNVYALPRAHAVVMPEARGIHAAQIKGRDIVPSQAVALSTALRDGAFPTADVDYRTALAYLRRETVALPDAPRGIVLLRHADRPLGFVKNIGNRANNLYPQSWRIMSTHAPEARPCIVL